MSKLWISICDQKCCLQGNITNWKGKIYSSNYLKCVKMGTFSIIV